MRMQTRFFPHSNTLEDAETNLLSVCYRYGHVVLNSQQVITGKDAAVRKMRTDVMTFLEPEGSATVHQSKWGSSSIVTWFPGHYVKNRLSFVRQVNAARSSWYGTGRKQRLRTYGCYNCIGIRRSVLLWGTKKRSILVAYRSIHGYERNLAILAVCGRVLYTYCPGVASVL